MLLHVFMTSSAAKQLAMYCTAGKQSMPNQVIISASPLCWQMPEPDALLVMQVTVGELIQEVHTEQELLGPEAKPLTKYDSVRRGPSQVPGKDLRPGAPKMQLRPHEEAQLPLVSCSFMFDHASKVFECSSGQISTAATCKQG